MKGVITQFDRNPDMASSVDFESWLSDKLRALNTDEEVFKPYIVSILEDSEAGGDDEDPAEAIDEVLAGMSDNESDNVNFRKLILERWQQEKSAPEKKSDQDTSSAEQTAPSDTMDINARLASITGSQNEAYKSSRSSGSKNNGPEPDRAVKEAILAQYAGAVEEESEEESDDGDLGANSNADQVAREQAEHREKCKQAALAKKEKDKDDREKQKKLAEDKKKKAQEKTAKGERRA